ncbi:RidA family protein [Georgenia yuyongxinii]|uniref:RidA family protein n=1 Tax=Georgenia yuyongxinii TaxID=2589797 RepID=A0A5B8C601_9MICO|nr:RidA family protein [Georgenia yuyongxinii]QDC25637.1 RidA family protein [Georgenia yuyongxinii]
MSTAPVLTNPEALGTPLGPYSHVSRAGDTVYVAGQVGVAPDGELAGEDVMAQTRQAFANIRMALESEGMGLENIARLTTYLVDADDIAPFYEVRAQIFPELFPNGKYPPNTLLVIERLVKPEFRIEIDAIGYAG